MSRSYTVSIPNGLPRPFRLSRCMGRYTMIVLVSIPNGLPRPFRLGFLKQWLLMAIAVSIPNGLPRPFRHSKRSIRGQVDDGFNPERASQAIPTSRDRRSALALKAVSIPNGLPRPFRLRTRSIAWEARKSKGFRESLFWGRFHQKKVAHFWAFSSSRPF